jgi:creatinine amidohydrolase
MPVMWLQDLTWVEVQGLAKDTPIVFPVAAVEQHGHHLPLFTDSYLLGEVVRRSAARYEERVVFAPLQWCGNSDHHLDFPGTISAPPRMYLDLLAGLLENFLKHGFRRLVLLNGHGGNIVPIDQVVFEVRQRHRSRTDLLLLGATYWRLGSQTDEPIAGLEQDSMGHACEWETSMMLRLAPALVRDPSGIDPVPSGNAFEPASRGWTTQDRSRPGHIGNPRAATAEKGEALFRRFTDDVCCFLDRVLAWDGASWNG